MEGLVEGGELSHPEAMEVAFRVLSVIELGPHLTEVDAYCWQPGMSVADFEAYDKNLTASGVMRKYLAVQTAYTPWINTRYKVNYIVPLYLPSNHNFTGSRWHFHDLNLVDNPFIIQPSQ